MRDKLSCVADTNEVADGKKRSATGWNPRSTQSRDVVWWLKSVQVVGDPCVRALLQLQVVAMSVECYVARSLG